MAKKNFDAFILAAGKKPKPTPEEVEAMAKQLHQAAATPVQAIVTEPLAAPKVKAQKSAERVAKPKPAATKKSALAGRPARLGRNADPAGEAKEKVRITIDLAKDLYKRMKLAVVQNETEISAYVRLLIEKDLSGK